MGRGRRRERAPKAVETASEAGRRRQMGMSRMCCRRRHMARAPGVSAARCTLSFLVVPSLLPLPLRHLGRLQRGACMQRCCCCGPLGCGRAIGCAPASSCVVLQVMAANKSASCVNKCEQVRTWCAARPRSPCSLPSATLRYGIPIGTVPPSAVGRWWLWLWLRNSADSSPANRAGVWRRRAKQIRLPTHPARRSKKRAQSSPGSPQASSGPSGCCWHCCCCCCCF